MHKTGSLLLEQQAAAQKTEVQQEEVNWDADLLLNSAQGPRPTSQEQEQKAESF